MYFNNVHVRELGISYEVRFDQCFSVETKADMVLWAYVLHFSVGFDDLTDRSPLYIGQ